jgi:hypothetical protein
MATSTKCYPWWHAKFEPMRQAKPIYVRSGCAINSIGNVNCAPEVMRENAERQMQAGGYLQNLSLETYTIARYITGEVGGGSPPGTLEEAVAVGEAAVNHAKKEGRKDANSVLLYRQAPNHPNYGFYGPIHGATTTSAPYGRWATTHADPTVLAILLADLITSGKSNNFSDGADDQASIAYAANFPSIPNYVTIFANMSEFWVGPLPGVNHWRTFLYKPVKGETSKTKWGADRIKYTLDFLAADMAANGGKRGLPHPWPTDLPICARGGLLAVGGILGVTMGALAFSGNWLKGAGLKP